MAGADDGGVRDPLEVPDVGLSALIDLARMGEDRKAVRFEDGCHRVASQARSPTPIGEASHCPRCPRG